MHGLFDVIDKDVISTDKFITEQNERARQMKEEMNHLIEYYTVLKKSGQLIFGEEINNQVLGERLGINNRTDDPEGRLLRERRGGAGSESDNSDDYLFGNESKFYRGSLDSNLYHSYCTDGSHNSRYESN